jgi:hypothetical protein
LQTQRCTSRHNLGFGFDDPIVASQDARPENEAKILLQIQHDSKNTA